MNKLEPFTRYDCEQDCSGYELGRAYMSECEIGDYVLYADAQAREAALVEALRLFVEEWDDLMMNQLASCYEYADALLAEYDAEKGFKSRIFAMLGGFLAEYDAEKGGAK